MCFPMLAWFLGSGLMLLWVSAAGAAESPTAVDRDAVLAKLKANQVTLLSLTIESKDGGPAVNLGTGLNAGEANNATDENLRLIAQLPEI